MATITLQSFLSAYPSTLFEKGVEGYAGVASIISCTYAILQFTCYNFWAGPDYVVFSYGAVNVGYAMKELPRWTMQGLAFEFFC